MRIGTRQIGRIGLAAGLLLAGMGPVWAQEEASAPPKGGTDAADYFLGSVLVHEHPWQSASNAAAGESPLTLWTGPNDSYLRASLKAEVAYFDQDNSWFGEPEVNIGANSTDWWESAIQPGVGGSYYFDGGGELYGDLSFVVTSTENIDAAGSNVGRGKDASHASMEHAYIGWRSGSRWSDLGKDFLDVSFGRQQYKAGTGFLFYTEASNGGNRGAYWIGERHSADFAGVATMNYDALKADLVYFEANDNPDTDTKVSGVTLDYDLEDLGGIGGGFYSIDSDISTRDGMDVFDIRGVATPFKRFDVEDWLAPLTFEGEFVHEDNGNDLEADGWYLQAGYGFANTEWTPTVTYRYASFEGDDPSSSKSENFDPLFYGFYDWGYWYQGEVLGEYALSNSNLNSHMVRIGADPLGSVHVNLFFYHFELDDAAGFGVSSDDFADEWDLTVDWAATDYLSLSLVAAYVDPNAGAKEWTTGNDDWSYVMLYASYSFK